MVEGEGCWRRAGVLGSWSHELPDQLNYYILTGPEFPRQENLFLDLDGSPFVAG